MSARRKASNEDPMVTQAFDAGKHDELAAAVAKLDPAEAEYFLHKLEAALRKRKIQLSGYLVAMLVWVIGMFFALVYFGLANGFVGWVFLLPFALVGVILYAFGKWADRVGTVTVPDAKLITPDEK
ncbi:MAG: hypothetical protein JWO36_3969 [Myxococcales bacterium]|nr:hypothetical protein [Myxococcales bacterium]